MARSTFKYLSLLLLLIALYFWKTLFTTQFSMLTEGEGVNVFYAWTHFWVSSIQHGSLPLWDRYTFSGHTFVGEMQTAAFYPLHLLLALVPLGDPRLLARVYEFWYVASHFLGACFMFALIREFGLRPFAALVAALAFALGGYLAIPAWPQLTESAIWLPLIFLFLLRALRAGEMRRALTNAALSGLALGLATLAGGLHIAIMQALIVATAAAYAAFRRPGNGRWTLAALVVAVVGAVAFAASAVQLFPSLEYGRLALRWINGSIALPATEKIPYAHLADTCYYWPHGFVGLLIPKAFGGKPFGASLGQGFLLPAYLGVFPFLAAMIGIWKCWSRPWVRYFAALAAAGFAYSLGPLSFLHGVLYALVPGLWTAREPDRFIYLTYFALAVLAAFGVEALFETTEEPTSSRWSGLNRVLVAALIACAALLAVPAVFGQPTIDPLVSLSIVLIAAACGLLLYLVRGHAGLAVKVLLVSLMLFDLSAFSSPAVNKIEAWHRDGDELERLLSMRGAADFLKARPGLFRVQVLDDRRPNFGDVFEMQTLLGGAVTMEKDYFEIHPRGDLLNARYIIRPASAPEPGAIYQDSAWKVYENPVAYPRAWIVHDTLVGKMDQGGVDLHDVAVLREPLGTALDPIAAGAPESATVTNMEARSMALKVHAAGRGLLVLSETFYPGWTATVDGRPALIHKVDGALRGIVVPPGDSRVELEYVPYSVLAGGILSLITFCGVLGMAIFRSLTVAVR